MNNDSTDEFKPRTARLYGFETWDAYRRWRRANPLEYDRRKRELREELARNVSDDEVRRLVTDLLAPGLRASEADEPARDA